MNATCTRTKLAAIREPGHPIGHPAPCWFHCPCGEKVLAFQPANTVCKCGTEYTPTGWIVSKP